MSANLTNITKLSRPQPGPYYLKIFRMARPIALPAARRAIRLPTFPLFTACTSPNNLASQYRIPRVLLILIFRHLLSRPVWFIHARYPAYFNLIVYESRSGCQIYEITKARNGDVKPEILPTSMFAPSPANSLIKESSMRIEKTTDQNAILFKFIQEMHKIRTNV